MTPYPTFLLTFASRLRGLAPAGELKTLSIAMNIRRVTLPAGFLETLDERIRNRTRR